MKKLLKDRFTGLLAARNTYNFELKLFRDEYPALFDAMAIELGWDRDYLGNYLGFGPCPPGGNAIMNGEAKPSDEDVKKLLNLYVTRKFR